MGEAKRRGTKEERIQQSIRRTLEEQAAKRLESKPKSEPYRGKRNKNISNLIAVLAMANGYAKF